VASAGSVLDCGKVYDELLSNVVYGG